MDHGRRMLIGVCGTAVCLLAAIAGADYDPTHITWNKWSIRSNEDIFLGKRYKGNTYPLTHLFDGDASTAWVFNAPPRPKPGKVDEINPLLAGRIILEIVPPGPIEMDRLRILSGYQKSQKLFLANDRPSELSLAINIDLCDKDAPTETFAIRDEMGWQDLAFKRTKVERLRIEVTKVTSGHIHDLCITELELYDGDKKIDPAMPAVVTFSPGSECGCFSEEWLITRSGIRVRGISNDNSSICFTPDGLHAAGVDNVTNRLWIINCRRNRVLRRFQLPQGEPPTLEWIGSEVRATFADKTVLYGMSDPPKTSPASMPASPSGNPTALSVDEGKPRSPAEK